MSAVSKANDQLFRDNSGWNMACTNGASQKFACTIFIGCAPHHHWSYFFLKKKNTHTLTVLIPLCSIEKQPKISFSPLGEKNFTRSSLPLAVAAVSRKFMTHEDFVDASQHKFMRHYLCRIAKNVYAPFWKTMHRGVHGARQNYP